MKCYANGYGLHYSLLSVAAPSASQVMATPALALVPEGYKACIACGAKRHPRTLEQTGGYCMKCYGARKA